MFEFLCLIFTFPFNFHFSLINSNRGAKKDPYAERKKPAKRYHSMKSPKYMVSRQIQPQQRIASQIGKS